VLRAYIAPDQSDWDKYLPLAEFAMNNSINVATGSTPFLMNSGQNPLTPASLPLAKANKDAFKFIANWEHQVKKAKGLMKIAQHRQQVQFNKKVQDMEFKIGTLVMLSTLNLRFDTGEKGEKERSKKLAPKHIGPFKILERVGKVAYKLELPTSMCRVHPVFHICLLKEHKSDNRYAPPPPIIDFIDGEEHYQLEAILGERKVGKAKHQQYHVKWVGNDVPDWLFEKDLFLDSPEFARTLVDRYRANKRARMKNRPRKAQ
jgi:hypothetical protein